MKLTRLLLAAALGLALPVLAIAPASASAPAGDSSGNRITGWVSCDDGPPGVLTVQPVDHLLSCADANSGLSKLTWSSWTNASATGTGMYYWNDCEPSCAAGTDHQSTATVKLLRPRTQSGEVVFTRAVIS